MLNLPVVALTDRDCASACDSFAGAVKDLDLATLIGTRTAGIVSGPAAAYVLTDNSQIRMPSRHDKAADGEVIDGVGVTPDIYLPRTAADLSTGRDPAMSKALSLLGH